MFIEKYVKKYIKRENIIIDMEDREWKNLFYLQIVKISL